MKHIIAVLVENRPGVLARIIGLISGRGYNIHSLNVAPTQDATTSRLTMIVPGEAGILEQVTKQLNKLVDVIKVYDLSSERHVSRELLLARIKLSSKNRAALLELAALCRAEIVCVYNQSLTVQLAGGSDEIDNFLELAKPHGILEVSCCGVMVIARSEN